MPQQPSHQKHFEALLDEIIFALVLQVMERESPEDVQEIFATGAHEPKLLEKLRSMNGRRHEALRGRKPVPEALKASRVRSDGVPDHMNGMDRAAREFMNSARSRVTRDTQK